MTPVASAQPLPGAPARTAGAASHRIAATTSAARPAPQGRAARPAARSPRSSPAAGRCPARAGRRATGRRRGSRAGGRRSRRRGCTPLPAMNATAAARSAASRPRARGGRREDGRAEHRGQPHERRAAAGGGLRDEVPERVRARREQHERERDARQLLRGRRRVLGECGEALVRIPSTPRSAGSPRASTGTAPTRAGSPPRTSPRRGPRTPRRRAPSRPRRSAARLHAHLVPRAPQRSSSPRYSSCPQ